MLPTDEVERPQQRIRSRSTVALYVYRVVPETAWWSDDRALCRGHAPGSSLPVASYEVHHSTGSRPVPVAVFAATGADPEIHVDARYSPTPRPLPALLLCQDAGGVVATGRR